MGISYYLDLGNGALVRGCPDYAVWDGEVWTPVWLDHRTLERLRRISESDAEGVIVTLKAIETVGIFEPVGV